MNCLQGFDAVGLATQEGHPAYKKLSDGVLT